jgi:cytochrome c556
MKRLIIGAALIGAMATVAVAKGDESILARQAAMKAVGAAAKAGDFAAMNEAALVAQEAFKVDTSDDGFAPTEARPEIWANMDAFGALMNDLVTKSAAADKSVFGSCKACHADYRAKN